MTKPKTLEQLRAEKERAETQLAQEQHTDTPLYLWFSRPSWLGFGTLYQAVSEMRILELLKENK